MSTTTAQRTATVTVDRDALERTRARYSEAARFRSSLRSRGAGGPTTAPARVRPAHTARA